MKVMLLILLLASPVFGQNSCWVPMGDRCPPGYRPTNDRATIVRWPISPQTCRPGFSPPGPMVPVAPVVNTPPQYVPSPPPVLIEDLPLPGPGTTEEPEQPEVPQTDPCKELALIVVELAASVKQTTENVNNLTVKFEDLSVRVDGLELLLSPENMDKLKGEKGDKGDQGPQGLQGPPGPAANFVQKPIYMEKVYMEREGVDAQGKTIWKEGTTTRELIPPGGGFRLRLFPPD